MPDDDQSAADEIETDEAVGAHGGPYSRRLAALIAAGYRLGNDGIGVTDYLAPQLQYVITEVLEWCLQDKYAPDTIPGALGPILGTTTALLHAYGTGEGYLPVQIADIETNATQFWEDTLRNT